MQKFHFKRTDRDALPRRDLAQIRILEQPVLLEFLAHQRQREFRAIDGHVQIAEHIGNRADVILVRVRKKNRLHLLLALLQESDVGNNDVDAEKLGFGEHQSRVDDDNFVSASQGHHVHAEFAKPAKRNCPNGRITQFDSPTFHEGSIVPHGATTARRALS